MRNPLIKRLPRELKSEFGKYLVIFLFLGGVIALVSGFLVASSSMATAYDESFEKYNIEDGNFELTAEADDTLIEALEKEDVTIYQNFYVEGETKEVDSTLRIFKKRTQVDLECLMEGEFPQKEDEIAIDRMYADNNELSVGDTLTIDGNEFQVTGLVALSDYSALFSNTADLMFDAQKFGVAVVTPEGFDTFGDAHLHYSYSWIYANKPADDAKAKEMAEDFMKVISANGILTNYIPQYTNQAIHFTGDDIVSDNAMMTVFLYIVIVIMAFVIAITTNSTIAKEAAVVGTLRASGYSRGELVRHYLILPTVVLAVAAVVGNILGYTTLKDFFAGMYYGSYSLPTYVTLWNTDAFVKTTIIPVLLMVVINFVMLSVQMRLSPLKFIRRDLKRRQKKKAFRLNTKIGIFHRFRLRVIFQNIPNYIMVVIGIFFANFILLFGLMFTPLLDQFSKDIIDNMICENQYVLKMPVETKHSDAEKYCAGTLMTQETKFNSEEVMIYGIEKDSRYIDAAMQKGKVSISNAYAEKYGLGEGDTITLKEEYSDKTYDFTIGGVYHYPSSIAVFLDIDEFRDVFDKDEGYFNGYFSNEKLDDIDEHYVATVITEDDLTKTSRQLKLSMGEVMNLFLVFGVIMSVLLIYLLSKIIIEKNTVSISMTKILGYTEREVVGLYVTPTTIVVILSILLTIPVCNGIMKSLCSIVFSSYPGYFPYFVTPDTYVKMIALAVTSYAVVLVLQMRGVKRIPKSEALKNVE